MKAKDNRVDSNKVKEEKKKKQWESPVLLDLNIAQSETMAFTGAGDADSGPKPS